MDAIRNFSRVYWWQVLHCPAQFNRWPATLYQATWNPVPAIYSSLHQHSATSSPVHVHGLCRSPKNCTLGHVQFNLLLWCMYFFGTWVFNDFTSSALIILFYYICVNVCVCLCFVMCVCFGNMYTVLWLRFFLPWLRFFHAFSSVVSQMPW